MACMNAHQVTTVCWLWKGVWRAGKTMDCLTLYRLPVDGRTKNRLKHQTAFRIQFMDMTPRDHIPWLMRSSHLLFSAEVNPPCPNSVIEALGCGLPVVGFDTGSLSELVQGQTGRLVPYGGNPWKLEPPDI